MIFISLPAVDEHFSAAHSIFAHNARSPNVGVHHVVHAILDDQQDVKHGIPREGDLGWIKNGMARTALHIQSMVAKCLMRLKETKDCVVVVVQQQDTRRIIV